VIVLRYVYEQWHVVCFTFLVEMEELKQQVKRIMFVWLTVLKRLLNSNSFLLICLFCMARQGKDSTQHRQLILTSLQKLLSGHVSGFKDAVKTHAEHVAQRNKRVSNKYGTSNVGVNSGGGSGSSSGPPAAAVAGVAGLGLGLDATAKYALFNPSAAPASSAPFSSFAGQELRNRRGGGGGAGAGVGAGAGGMDSAVPPTAASSSSSSGLKVTSGAAVSAEAEAADSYDNDKKYGSKNGPAGSTGPTSPPAVFASAFGTSNHSGGRSGNSGNSNISSLHHRSGHSSIGGGLKTNSVGSGGSGGGGFLLQQQQQQQQAPRGTQDRYRLRMAEQAESSIAQVGAVAWQKAFPAVSKQTLCYYCVAAHCFA
jgi:hypothetical protein